MRTGIVFAATGQNQSGRNQNQEERFHAGNLPQIVKIQRSITALKQHKTNVRIPWEMRCVTSPSIPAAQPYCGGALVDGASGAGAAGALAAGASGAGAAGALTAGAWGAGAAGALTAGASGAGAAGALTAGASGAGAAGALVADIVGGVPVSACFLQPVNSPTQTSPDTATNDNNFFIFG
jgi:hypothetical protein